MANCRNSIPNPSRKATLVGAPAITATDAAATASRPEGNGWTMRTSPTIAGRPGSVRSDVDDLVETGGEVCDQAVAGVWQFSPEPRHEEMERDRGHDQVTLGIYPDGLGSPATAGKDAPKGLLVEAGGPAQDGPDPRHAAPLAHTLPKH